MVWAAIYYRGPLYIVVLKGSLGSKYYCDVLKEALLPRGREMHGDVQTLVPHNVSIHALEYTKYSLQSQVVYVLPQTAKAPDINMVENVCGAIGCLVYAQGHQFAGVDGLISAVQNAWSSTESDYLNILHASIPRRLIRVLQNNGRMTDY